MNITKEMKVGREARTVIALIVMLASSTSILTRTTAGKLDAADLGLMLRNLKTYAVTRGPLSLVTVANGWCSDLLATQTK